MEKICWILGRGGLLGKSLQSEIKSKGIQEFVPKESFVWQNEEVCKVKEKHWQIYWAAGTGTMGSTEADLQKETVTLRSLLTALEESKLIKSAGTIIYASSAGAMYAGCKDDIITEESQPKPENPYGYTKLAEEEILKTFAKNHQAVSLLIARITNLYGPAQSTSKRQGLISHIARSISKKRPINIFVPFDTIRDYIPADSAASMMIKTAEMLTPSTVTTKIIASEEPTSIARIIGAFTSITRIPPRVITSASSLSSTYPHRMCFHSTVEPKITQSKTLLVGIAEVLAAERLAQML
jgi:UDP-glucose 4-epimerase